MRAARSFVWALLVACVVSACTSSSTVATPPAPDPYVAELQGLALKITAAGGTAVFISGADAQLAVRKLYGKTTIPSFAKNVPALETHWTTAVSQSFNGTDPASTLEEDELVRFNTSASSAVSGRFWTLLDQVVKSPGVAYGPRAVKDILALPDVPKYVGLGGSPADNSTVYIGKAASNHLGSGGGLQLFALNYGVGVTSLKFSDYQALVASQPF